MRMTYEAMNWMGWLHTEHCLHVSLQFMKWRHPLKQPCSRFVKYIRSTTG